MSDPYRRSRKGNKHKRFFGVDRCLEEMAQAANDHIERFPFVEASIEFRNKAGDLVVNVPMPQKHGCALPPGWGALRVGVPARVIYEGPYPTAEQVWSVCQEEEPRPEIEAGLAILDGLPRVERDAFLGLFAGAKWTWTIWADTGRPFTMRKCECQAVEDWRGFYLEKLPAAGLLTFTETEPYETASGPAYKVEVRPTELAWEVREAFYERNLR